jgi:hypothetical protein
VCHKIATHLLYIIRGVCDFGNPIVGRGRRRGLQFNLLMSIHRQAGISTRSAGAFCGCSQADRFEIKLSRFVDIGHVKADVIDSGDARALGRVLRPCSQRGYLESEPNSEKNCGMLPVNPESPDEFLHGADSSS